MARRFHLGSVTLITVILLGGCALMDSGRRSEKIIQLEDSRIFRAEAEKLFRSKYGKAGMEKMAGRLLRMVYGEGRGLQDSLMLYLEKNAHPVLLADLYHELSSGDIQNADISEVSRRLALKAAEYSSTAAFADSLTKRYRQWGQHSVENEKSVLRARSAIFLTYCDYLKLEGDPESALALYNSILDKYESAEVYLERAELLGRFNRYEEALSSAIKALEMLGRSRRAETLIRENARTLVYRDAAVEQMIRDSRLKGRQNFIKKITDQENGRRLPGFSFLDGNNKLFKSTQLTSDLNLIFLYKSGKHSNKMLEILASGVFTPVRSNNIIAVNCDPHHSPVSRESVKSDNLHILSGGPDVPRIFQSKELPSLFLCDKNLAILEHIHAVTGPEELEFILRILSGLNSAVI